MEVVVSVIVMFAYTVGFGVYCIFDKDKPTLDWRFDDDEYIEG